MTTDTARTGENELDRALVERVQGGYKRAFDLLVRKYQHKVVGLVSRYVRSHAECEDIAQESFIRASMDGVVAERLVMCDNWTGEQFMAGEDLKEAGVPYIRLDRDYINVGAGQLRTRIQAFLEMMGR